VNLTELAAQGFGQKQYVDDSSAAIQGPAFSSFSPLTSQNNVMRILSSQFYPCNLCFFPLPAHLMHIPGFRNAKDLMFPIVLILTFALDLR
jgi:hypothetical protein